MTFDSSGGGLPGVIPDSPSPSPVAAPPPAVAPASGGAAAVPGAPASPSPAGAAGAASADPAIPPTGETPAGETPEDPNAQPYTFAGKTFKSVADAENYLRSQDGRVTAQAKQLSEYASVTRAWMEYAEGLKRGPQPATQGNPNPTTTPAAPADPNAWLDGLDWEFHAQLAKENGPEYAAHWLAQRMNERLESRFNELRDSVQKPIQEQNARAAEHTRVASAFDAVAMKVGADGQPVFPELLSEDPAVAEAVMEYWRSLPDNVRTTERGVVLAIGEYRMASGGVPPRPAVGTGAPSPSQQVREAQAVASAPIAGSGALRPAGAMTPDARIRQAIRDAGVARRSGNVSLGFAE